MTDEHSPPRNHRRTNSPQQNNPLPPPMPPRPIMLARPSQGYPFPVMSPSTPHDEQVLPPQKKVSVQLPTPSQHRRRKAAQQNDGWDTPPSSAPNSRVSTPSASGGGDPSRPFAMTRMSSTFSSGSSDATPSSSSCETPDDEGASSSSDVGGEDDDADDDAEQKYRAGDSDGPYREQAAAKATRRLRKQLKQSGPPTPADMVHARTKHAGSTPGAPPPAPFYHPDFDHPSDTLLDREDVRTHDEDEEAHSGRSSPRKEMTANPLSNRIGGMSLSQA